MHLRELINTLTPVKTWGNLDIHLSSLVDDSRKVIEGSCYVAVKGTSVDGHAFISQAIESGATAIIAQTTATHESMDKDIAWIQLKDTSRALPCLAATWYRHPAEDLKLIGVTGTNGKTTTTYLLHSLFEQVWHRAGLIGTIVVNDGMDTFPAKQTTPGTVELNALLSRMALNDCRAVAMEVSSHALTQNRVDGIPFDVTIFTNLTQDHLDYHKSMDSYYEAKKRLFEMQAALCLSKNSRKKPVAVINIDDPSGERLVNQFSGKLPIRTYGFSAKSDYRAVIKKMTSKGSEFELKFKERSYMVKTPLVGRFNVYNALAALVGALAAGVTPREAVKALADTPQVPGRMEMVGCKSNIHGFVDYAHTPDALTNVCRTLKDLCPGRLVTVFGCGGDRDQTKRPLMGAAAAEFSDLCIITSDNPRSEDPEAIISDIVPGLIEGHYKIIADRKEAIRVAVELAAPGDFILVAGKGHEDYQEIADKRIPFDDKTSLRMCLENWGNY